MTMKSNYKVTVQQLFICLILSFPVIAHAETVQGTVVHIADGDTLTLLTSSNKQIKIRLAGIDSPEKSQPFGNKAKQALAALTFQKYVIVNVQTIDRYGRSVGRVYVQGLDVNAELVKHGYAWVYRKYTNDEDLYAFEAEAKLEKRGLWLSQKPIAPWNWRKGQRTVEHNPTMVKGMIIGNINSKVYHLPVCPSYSMVSTKNRVLFTDEALAVANGYRKAGNCP